MAKYLLLHDMVVQAKGEGVPFLHKAGEVIEYDGTPNASMAVLDAEAQEARRPLSRYGEIAQASGIAALSRAQKKLVERAKAEMGG